MRRAVLNYSGHSNTFRKCKSVVDESESLLAVGEVHAFACLSTCDIEFIALYCF